MHMQHLTQLASCLVKARRVKASSLSARQHLQPPRPIHTQEVTPILITSGTAADHLDPDE
jgi:hypothetical protein